MSAIYRYFTRKTSLDALLLILILIGGFRVGQALKPVKETESPTEQPSGELRKYVDFVNEFTERRRVNTYFANERPLSYGAQVGYVNVGRGNLTFVRRDLVAVGRIPLVCEISVTCRVNLTFPLGGR